MKASLDPNAQKLMDAANEARNISDLLRIASRTMEFDSGMSPTKEHIDAAYASLYSIRKRLSKLVANMGVGIPGRTSAS